MGQLEKHEALLAWSKYKNPATIPATVDRFGDRLEVLFAHNWVPGQPPVTPYHDDQCEAMRGATTYKEDSHEADRIFDIVQFEWNIRLTEYLPRGRALRAARSVLGRGLLAVRYEEAVRGALLNKCLDFVLVGVNTAKEARALVSVLSALKDEERDL